MACLLYYPGMNSFYDRLKLCVESKGLTFNRLQFMAEIPSGHFSQWKKGVRRPSDNDLRKLAAVEALELPIEELTLWRLIDEFPEVDLGEFLERVNNELAEKQSSQSK